MSKSPYKVEECLHQCEERYKQTSSGLLRAICLPSARREGRCVSKDVACRCAFLLHLHPPLTITHLTVCVPEGSEAKQNDRGT